MVKFSENNDIPVPMGMPLEQHFECLTMPMQQTMVSSERILMMMRPVELLQK